MARNEEGEFELILGNKQLLSVFFIVVVLLGVFFAMGYIMGRNSTPPAEMAKGTEPPLVVDASKPSAATPSPVREPEPVRTEAKRPEPQIEVRTDTKPEIKKEEPKPKPEPAREEKKAAAPKKADTDPLPRKVEGTKEAPFRGASPTAGAMYLQVVAAKKPEAELISEVLGRKGYSTYLAPIADKPDIIRVLVGPIRDPKQQAKLNDELKGQGFKPFPRKM